MREKDCYILLKIIEVRVGGECNPQGRMRASQRVSWGSRDLPGEGKLPRPTLAFGSGYNQMFCGRVRGQYTIYPVDEVGDCREELEIRKRGEVWAE